MSEKQFVDWLMEADAYMISSHVHQGMDNK